MAEETIRRSPRAGSRKKRKNQIPIAFAVLIVIIAVGIWLSFTGQNLALYWITGLGMGFVLQRARFCFTASLRDPYLTGSTTVTRAVLIAFAITSIAFTAMKYGAYSQGLPIPGQSYIAPVGIHTVIGAFMFGIGMVISGGCASGTLMRVGEGFSMQMLTLFFFIVGSAVGAYNFGWWERNFIVSSPRIFLPDVMGGVDGPGWIIALVANLLVIAVLYVLAYKWENRKKKTD